MIGSFGEICPITLLENIQRSYGYAEQPPPRTRKNFTQSNIS